jgi:hypothetical protein
MVQMRSLSQEDLATKMSSKSSVYVGWRKMEVCPGEDKVVSKKNSRPTGRLWGFAMECVERGG